MKLYKLNRYILGLSGILFLYINSSWAKEYGVGIIYLPEGPVKNYVLPKNSQDNTMEFRWQITNDTDVPVAGVNGIKQTKATTTLQIGDKSYIYVGSEVFSQSELVSFAGVYHIDGKNQAIAYLLERNPVAGGGYRWKMILNDPFDPLSTDGYNKIINNPFTQPMSSYTEVPVFVRVDYKTGATKPRTVYSVNIDPEDKQLLDRGFKDNDKNNKNFDKKTINIGKYGNINNVTVNYCAFDVNEDAKAEPIIRYLGWVELDRPEWVTSGDGEIKKTRAPAVFSEFSVTGKGMTFSISLIKAKFVFKPNTLPEEEVGALQKLSFPDKIKNLESFKSTRPHYGLVSGVYNNKSLLAGAICYTWRSQVKSGRTDRDIGDTIGISAINDSWDELNNGELKKLRRAELISKVQMQKEKEQKEKEQKD
jgi:hypothetical protein